MKKMVLVLMLISATVMTGCMRATLEEKQKKQKENGEEVVEYDKIEDMDFSSGHIQGVLRENFIVDADVPTEVPSKCGTYEIARKELDKSEEEYEKYFVDVLDGYFQNDCTVSWEDQMGYILKNARYNGNYGVYYKKEDGIKEDVYSWYYTKIRDVDRYFYEYGFEYDKEFIDGVVKEFVEKCANILPDGINGDYVCVHVDNEYREYLNEKYGKEEMNRFWGEDDREYYAIAMYSEVDEDLFFRAFTQKHYDVEKGEEVDDICDKLEDTYDGADRVVSHIPQSVILVVSEDGEVVYVKIEDYYTIGEEITRESIISAEEALDLFYEQFDGIIFNEEIIVRAITLEYQVKLDKADENGYRNAYIIPVWVIRYKTDLDYWDKKIDRAIVLEAIDGSVFIGKDEAY